MYIPLKKRLVYDFNPARSVIIYKCPRESSCDSVVLDEKEKKKKKKKKKKEKRKERNVIYINEIGTRIDAV